VAFVLLEENSDIAKKFTPYPT